MKTNASHPSFALRPVLAGLLTACAVLPAWAGLGALRVLSTADEAFYAEVAVEPEAGLSAPTASLASLERYPMLGPYAEAVRQLAIRTSEVSPGRYLITLSGPVLPREQGLHFALELSWPSGRAIREYHLPASGQWPVRPDKKPSPHSALPAEKPSFITGAATPAFGAGRLLSVRGLPLRMEVELLGDWPTADHASQFQLAALHGLGDAQAVRFALRSRGGRQFLRLHHPQPVTSSRIGFELQARLGEAEVVRRFSVAVPKAGQRYRKHVAPSAQALPVDGYRVKAGDSLNRLAQRYAPAARQAWMTAVLARNPQAFAGGDRDLLFAGAWLVFPEHKPAPTASTHDSAVTAPAKAAATPSASVAPPAPVASAPSVATPQPSGKIGQQLKAAQQRMKWLEAEISRLEASPAPTVAASAAPAMPPLSDSEAAFLDGRLTEWVLTGVGGISVASLLAWMLLRRRKQKPADSAAEAGQTPAATPPVVAVASALVSPPPAPAEEIRLDTVDVLAEADVLLAYGRSEAAESLLRNALRAEPEREDLRIKLLDLIAAQGNHGEFEAVALDVLAVFGPLSGLWTRVQQLGATLDADNPLYRAIERPMSEPVVLASAPAEVEAPEVPLPAAAVAIAEPLPPSAPVAPEPELPEFVAPEPVVARRVADFAANDRQPVSVAGELSEQAAIAELAQLYREMGDSEMADTLLRDAGLLEAPKEAVDGS
ncbi:type IV pilus assembly protein FimV [Vogesella indigofera]|uniref:FimV N-terminal domain-containing protein n=1 Tax=Vogesella indigofera TaxID=45465 RepID=A0ABT5I4W2_VOGIN|nr:hypothetical protein [Vogesella indigofera]MDC7691219.1 hypothetical protein [Vogesella indigofera]